MAHPQVADSPVADGVGVRTIFGQTFVWDGRDGFRRWYNICAELETGRPSRIALVHPPCPTRAEWLILGLGAGKLRYFKVRGRAVHAFAAAVDFICNTNPLE